MLTKQAMTKFAVALGMFAGTIIFVSNVRESGFLHALGLGILVAGLLAIMGRIGARLFGASDNNE